MDKKWIYILIILIIGAAALTFIVESSTTVGSAVIAVDTFTTTLPDHFNIEDSDRLHSTILNRATDEKIYIEALGKGNLTEKSFKEKLIDIQNDENATNINTTTDSYNNITLKNINYEKLPDNRLYKASFFMKYNHTFFILSKNYQDMNTLDKQAQFVIDTLQPDYKKSQD